MNIKVICLPEQSPTATKQNGEKEREKDSKFSVHYQ